MPRPQSIELIWGGTTIIVKNKKKQKKNLSNLFSCAVGDKYTANELKVPFEAKGQAGFAYFTYQQHLFFPHRAGVCGRFRGTRDISTLFA